jgi:hypothetical protein
MLVQTTHSLQDPSGKSLYQAWKKSNAEEKKEISDDKLADTRIGSGSDHTVFLNFVGMPVIGLGFDGPYGVYHSMYDDFYWMNHFGDPGYHYHTLMSQLWGVLALRLANADITVRLCHLRAQHSLVSERSNSRQRYEPPGPSANRRTNRAVGSCREKAG